MDLAGWLLAFKQAQEWGSTARKNFLLDNKGQAENYCSTTILDRHTWQERSEDVLNRTGGIWSVPIGHLEGQLNRKALTNSFPSKSLSSCCICKKFYRSNQLRVHVCYIATPKIQKIMSNGFFFCTIHSKFHLNEWILVPSIFTVPQPLVNNTIYFGRALTLNFKI